MSYELPVGPTLERRQVQCACIRELECSGLIGKYLATWTYTAQCDSSRTVTMYYLMMPPVVPEAADRRHPSSP